MRCKGRSLLGFLIYSVCLPPAIAQNDPPESSEGRKLFQAMESKLEGSKTLAVAFDLQVKFQEPGVPETKAASYKGTWLFADENRARLDVNRTSPDPALFKSSISDGPEWWWYDLGSPPHRIHKRSLISNKDLIVTLVRAGVFIPTTPLPPVEAANTRDRFRLANFRLGPTEKIDGEVVRRIDFQLFLKGQDGSFDTSLWIARVASTPVRRVVTQKLFGAEGLIIKETYSKVVVDGTVDSKKFDMPPLTKDTIEER